MTGHVEVAIVGAGFAGIAAALELREAGHEVVVLERGDRVGGTWRDNTYPGVACDVPAHLYGLARHPNPGWSAEFAPGAEIRDYLDDVVDRTRLRPSIRFGAVVTGADWDASRSRWRLEGTAGTPESADVLILATGRLTEPRIPEIAGLAGFAGEVVHTARWRPGLDVAGRRVAVVGTGSSAVQVVPELARRGAEITVFQRSAAWILPRGGRTYDAAERTALAADPAAVVALRAEARAGEDARFAARAGLAVAGADAGGADAADARAAAFAHLAAQVRDPKLRAALTPDYPFGCKRVALSDDFYPVFDAGRATLEPSALVAADGDRLTAASGAHHDGIDLLVLATGFEASRPAYAEWVRGEGGTPLADHWARGMSAAWTTMVAGFPNLFILGGPHAALAHTSAILVLERQAAFVRDLLAAPVAATDPEPRAPSASRVLRADAEDEASFARDIDARTAGTSWLGGCDSWYLDDRSGRTALLWPGTVDDLDVVLAAGVREITGRTAPIGGGRR